VLFVEGKNNTKRREYLGWKSRLFGSIFISITNILNNRWLR